MSYPITVVGLGPGSEDYLLPAAKKAVLQADVIVGGAQALQLFASTGKDCCRINSNLEEVLDFIEEATRKNKRVAVLLSGDPGYFSLLPRLKNRFGKKNLIIIPGISFLQLACAKLGITWEGFLHVSLHGRSMEELEAVGDHHKVAVLTERRFPPSAVCSYFLEKRKDFKHVWILTDLGLPEEQITSTTLSEGAQIKDRANSIVFLLKSLPEPNCYVESEEEDTQAKRKQDQGREIANWADLLTPGLPDKLFLRGDLAMSKEEVRALTLCKARLRKGTVVCEIGAGSGSWTVEAARLIAPGRVFAFEKNPQAVNLARANLEHFHITNVSLTEGEAPEACQGLPAADCVLIGGSGGRLKEILEAAHSWLKPKGRLVMTAVTPETFNTAWQILQEDGWREQDFILMQLARMNQKKRARYWRGENPVFILSATRI